ncbi:hypothetical protein SKAU_G00304320 [Synaphobranchus kaupii]|uniref:Uncharacterized protein n=1 Tax=Synaphobranchus kaupii TaxID=118154 RepID=A0A9Q1EWA0_SYNKA|nr:hypothetical protein SKAU_G00304320 [Synaphobranchus kaupii]
MYSARHDEIPTETTESEDEPIGMHVEYRTYSTLKAQAFPKRAGQGGEGPVRCGPPGAGPIRQRFGTARACSRCHGPREKTASRSLGSCQALRQSAVRRTFAETCFGFQFPHPFPRAKEKRWLHPAATGKTNNAGAKTNGQVPPRTGNNEANGPSTLLRNSR